MRNILNEFIIEITILELEQKIREYYLSLDDSITDVNVEYSSRWVQGGWNEAWQRHLGGYRDLTANVKIIRKINVFGENRTVEISQCLGTSNFIHILSILLEKDNLKATFVDEDNNSSKIRISCEEIINHDKENVPLSGSSLKLKKHLSLRRNLWK